MSFLRRLFLGILGLFDALWIGVRNGLFGVPQADPLTFEAAEAIAEEEDQDHTSADLHAELAVERAKEAALVRAAARPPTAPFRIDVPEPERWYRVLGPDDSTVAYAYGTPAEAEEYWEVGADGWRVQPVESSQERFTLDAVRSAKGGRLRGARVRALSDEIAEWREERTSSFN